MRRSVAHALSEMYNTRPEIPKSRGPAVKKDARPRAIGEWLVRPVIPVVWRTDADAALLAGASLIFLQGCELADLPGMLDWLKGGAAGRVPVVVHLDLLGGLASDEAGLRHLAGVGRIDGVITVRPHLVEAARRLGFAVILLQFLQDGRAVERGLHVVERSKPDAVELVPGAAAADVVRSFTKTSTPVIAGGLIRSPDLVRRLVEAGCAAVSTSDPALWELNRSAR